MPVMDDVSLARALHVLAVVIWIGGVSMATTVALPALRRGDFGPNLLQAFVAIERRFIWQARISVIIVGITGLYMLWRLDLWDRFHSAAYWWMHAMVCVWLLFALVLFVGAPFVLHRRLPRWASIAPQETFKWLHRVHWVLLLLSLVTILGAVAGSHGLMLFT